MQGICKPKRIFYHSKNYRTFFIKICLNYINECTVYNLRTISLSKKLRKTLLYNPALYSKSSQNYPYFIPAFFLSREIPKVRARNLYNFNTIKIYERYYQDPK